MTGRRLKVGSGCDLGNILPNMSNNIKILNKYMKLSKFSKLSVIQYALHV